MALTSVRLKNFKCFADSGEIPLAPLTVIFGRNNTGKSSILQSLLLLRQTLDSPGYGQQLNLGGLLYPAGSYGDIVHQHRASDHVTMYFTVTPRKGKRVGKLELEFRSAEPNPPHLSRLKVSGGGVDPLEFRRGRGAGGPYELRIGGRKLGIDRRAGFVFGVNSFLPLLGDEPPRVGRPSGSRKRSRTFARDVLREFERVLREVRAIGAFRRQPKRQYEYQGHTPEAIDLVGANVVGALIEDATLRGKRRGKLLESVNNWLRQVGRVRLRPLRRISTARRIYDIRLQDTDSGRWANFADVGFGIGQAFPVIVEGLRAPTGATFLVEEPEIHLHPDAQLAMGDFLADLARSGKQVIVETHSENLLLRIRHLIVGTGNDRAGKPRLDSNDVSIIYVDTFANGTSRARKLNVDTLGQVKEWPAGFMEEATTERLAILESMGKRVESGR